MREVSLVRVPGSGLQVVEIRDGWSVSRFVDEFQLHGRDIVINGRGVPQSDWESVTLSGAHEIFATAAVKGN